VLATVTSQVRLSVAVDVESAHHARALTGAFQMAVWTVLPCHATSRGRPTLTESKRAITFFPTSLKAPCYVQRHVNFSRSAPTAPCFIPVSVVHH
jgi:hypothetical protein